MAAHHRTHQGAGGSGCAAPSSDAELLAGCRSGDEAAWSELVERYERLVFSIPLRLGLSREDAADVTQLTFATLVEAVGRIDKAESLGSWLMTVARRTTWRVRDRRDREVVDGDVGADIEVELGDAELAETLMVHEALAQIGKTCRDLLRALFAEEEPSYVAVARRMGKPVGSIGPMRSRCLGRLRIVLEAHEVVPSDAAVAGRDSR